MMDGKKKKYNQLLNKDTFHLISLPQTVAVAQLVRASDCGSEGRGFEPHHPPQELKNPGLQPGFGFKRNHVYMIVPWSEDPVRKHP